MKLRKRYRPADILTNGGEMFRQIRWGGRVYCPYCHSYEVYDCRVGYKCKRCGNRFTDRTRTFMHNSKLPVEIWMLALYYMIVLPAVSSVRLSILVGVSQKTGWLMMQKIRWGLTQGDIRLEGDVLAMDEMYVGGSWTNFHYGKKQRLLHRGHYREDREGIYAACSDYKSHIFGVNDGERIVLYNTPNPIISQYIIDIYKGHTSPDKQQTAISDCSGLYRHFERLTGDRLYTNNHKKGKYISEIGLSSNAIEGTFSHYKRNHQAHYIRPSRQYLQLYLNEFVYRWNYRDNNFTDTITGYLSVLMNRYISTGDLYRYDPFAGYVIPDRPGLLSEADLKSVLSGSLVVGVEQKHRHYTLKDFG